MECVQYQIDFPLLSNTLLECVFAGDMNQGNKKISILG